TELEISSNTDAWEIAVKEEKIEEEKKAQEEAQRQAAQQAAAQTRRSTDPMGFMSGKIRYDFIIDDGNFDTTSDFLGAANGWSEMTRLDNGIKDNKITSQELSDNGIKLVKTYFEGGKKVQKVVDAKEEFGDDFSLDLSSYRENTDGSMTHKDIDTGDHDNDGILNQSLLGVFNVNIGDKVVQGYQTDDDTNWLHQTYGLSDNSMSQLSGDSANHFNFFVELSNQSQELRNEADTGMIELGLDSATVNMVKRTTINEGRIKATTLELSMQQDIQKQIELDRKEKAEKELEEQRIKEEKEQEELEKQKLEEEEQEKQEKEAEQE
ncbi:hypothetical protein IJ670_08155, partial [bacterium]|nr:hypothetical protein [bacterium]